MKSNIKISVFNSIEISIDKKRAEQRPCVSDYHHIKSIRNFDCISFHRLGWKLQNVGKNYVREMKEIHRRVQCYAAAACADIYVHLIFRCANANNRYVIIQNSHSLLCFLYIPPSYICLKAVLLLTVGITNDTRMRVIMHTQTIQC